MNRWSLLVGGAALVGLAVVLGAAGGLSSTTGDQAARVKLKLRLVASGFAEPTFLGAPRSEPGLLYVVEKAGRILVLDNGRRRGEAFLDIRNLVGSRGSEQGLFSVAFHPNYAQNHRFYVDYTDTRGDTQVVEYRSDGRRALPGTRRQIFFQRQPFSNHNGGQLAFGPDGRLYVGMGDGGSAGDPFNNAQTMGSYLGKLLWLDVDAPEPKPHIADLGLRNPWRFSFDRRTHDLYIGDVGQDEWEEVDFVSHKALHRLRNFGWSVYEGRSAYDRRRRTRAGALARPIAVYSHRFGCSVTGGYVYRGRALRSVRGRYFYGDWCTSRVWSLRVVRGRARTLRIEPLHVAELSTFGEDARGELYLAGLGGQIYRLTR